MRVAVLASGHGSNLQALLDHAAAGRVQAQVTLLWTDKPGCGAVARARRAGVATIAEAPKEKGETSQAYDARLLEALRAERPDLVVLAGYMRIVGPTVTQAFPGRIVNIHPSLLPSFRGLAAVAQAHAARVKVAGCTTHLVTDELDGGPILLQAALPVRDGESVEHLQQRILRLEHLLLPRTVQLFAEGRVTPDGRILPGPSWLGAPGLDLVSGAMYGEGF